MTWLKPLMEFPSVLSFWKYPQRFSVVKTLLVEPQMSPVVPEFLKCCSWARHVPRENESRPAYFLVPRSGNSHRYLKPDFCFLVPEKVIPKTHLVVETRLVEPKVFCLWVLEQASGFRKRRKEGCLVGPNTFLVLEFLKEKSAWFLKGFLWWKWVW